MPLVVSGVTSTSGDKTEEWQNKLVGKKLSESESDATTFCRNDLPKGTRVLVEPGAKITRDHRPDRLNVIVSEDGMVSRVYHGLPSAPKQKLKSSIQRALRSSLVDTYPLLAPHIDEILPKKGSLESIKLPDRNVLYALDSLPLFYEQDGKKDLTPHLKLVHRFPHAFPSLRIDRGAIRFVLSGATLMAPGLTSPGGRLPVDRGEAIEQGQGVVGDGRWSRELLKGETVVIMAEGKEEACAVGTLVMGTEEVKATGKGPVVEDAHFLGDGLWKFAL